MAQSYVCPDRAVTVPPSAPKGQKANMLILTKGPVHSEHGDGGINRGVTKRKLISMLSRAGIPHEDVAFANISCWFKRSGDHTVEELRACSEHLADFIEDVNPNIIVAMGTEAFDAACEKTGLSMYLHRSDLFKSRFGGRKMMATYSPGMTFREWDKQQEIELDLKKAWSTAHTPDWPLTLGKDYFVLTTPEEVQDALDYLRTRPIVTFDIETEGFDLFEQDEILCVQFSSKKGEGFVIPLRGQWQMNEEDTYGPWQIARGRWATDTTGRRVLYDTDSERAHERDKRRKVKVFKPLFPAGSPVCRTPDAHDPASPAYEKTGHICRGTVTNVLRGFLEPCTALGRMNGKMVPHDYNVIVEMLKDFLEGPTLKAAQNGKFDVHGLKYQLGIRTRAFDFDTILAHHLVHEEIPHDLDYIRSLLTWMPRYNVELKSYVPSKKHSFALVPNEVLWFYGAADVDCEFRIIEPLREWMALDNPENEWLFRNISVPLSRALCQIEENGIVIDMARLEELSKWYREKIQDLKDELAQMCIDHGLTPVESWTNDNQLRAWMFNDDYEWTLKKATKTLPAHVRVMKGLGLPVYMAWKSKKTGAPSTGKKSMVALKNWCAEDVAYEWRKIDNHDVRVATTRPLSDRTKAKRAWKRDFLTKIDELKKATKAKNQFLDGDDSKEIVGAKALLKHIKSDGRVHSTYNQLIETARLSSKDPNLQNISNVGECKDHDRMRCPPGCPNEYRHYSIRSMYTVPDDHVWLAADYRSEEVRIIAYLAQEDSLLASLFLCECGENFAPSDDDPARPLKQGKHEKDTGHKATDIHQLVASKVFGVPYENVTKEQRRQCKAVTFGMAYGQTEQGLAEALGWSVKRAKEFSDFYFKAFPKLKSFRDRRYKQVEAGKDIPNALGRLRHTFGPVEMKGWVERRDYFKVVSAMQRERLNYDTQSSAADVISLCTIALADVWGYEDGDLTDAHKLGVKICGFAPAVRLRDIGVKIINSVHDALEFECPKDAEEEARDIIEKVMVELPWRLLGWYLPVDLTSGRYWDDVGDYDEYSAERAAQEEADTAEEVAA